MAGPPEAMAAAARLRGALAVIERDMPEGRDKTNVLRLGGMAVAALERNDSRAICRRCNVQFSFDAERFRSLRLTLPRHCYHCRQVRRAERRQAGEQFPAEENDEAAADC